MLMLSGVPPSSCPSLLQRIGRHVRLSRQAATRSDRFTPPFLIVFINSICNLTCEHCFYWESLNKKDDLTFEEFDKLTAELGQIENLSSRAASRSCGPSSPRSSTCSSRGTASSRSTSRPTATSRTAPRRRSGRSSRRRRSSSSRASSRSTGCPSTTTGSGATRSRSRRPWRRTTCSRGSRQEDPRLRIHAISTATNENLEELRQLTDHLFERCPKMDHHNLAIIRGDRKNPSLKGPQLEAYDTLYKHLRALWADREKGRFGGDRRPDAHVDQAQDDRPPDAGRAVQGRAALRRRLRERRRELLRDAPAARQPPQAVVLRDLGLAAAKQLRADVAAKKCFCTNEIFMWPSIAFQPLHLAKALVGSKAFLV